MNRVIDTYVVSDRLHVLVLFDDDTFQTYRRVEVKPRTWRTWFKLIAFTAPARGRGDNQGETR